jgi:hypothetical protein
LLPWLADNASEEIIQPQRINELHRTNWSLKNFVDSVAPILPIKKPSNGRRYLQRKKSFPHSFSGAAQSVKEGEVKDRPVALTARAPDSKSGCWGFESLLACHLVNFFDLKAGRWRKSRNIGKS